MKDLHLERIPVRALRERLEEDLKELNILYMIMKRELSLLIPSLKLEPEDSHKGITLEALLDKYNRGHLGESEVVRLNLDRGISGFVISGE